MAKQYWAKIWIEMVDDPKVMKMPDWLFRRFIYLILMAKENDHDGLLQPVQDLAWRLRLSEKEITESLQALSEIGVTQKDANGWWIKNFNKRQVFGITDGAYRMRRFRERHKSDESDAKSNATGDASHSSSSSYSLINSLINKESEKTLFSFHDAARAICETAKWVSTPGDWNKPIEITMDYLQQYGWDQTMIDLKLYANDWINHKRQDNGANYSLMNPQWIYRMATHEPLGPPKQLTKEEKVLADIHRLAERNEHE